MSSKTYVLIAVLAIFCVASVVVISTNPNISSPIYVPSTAPEVPALYNQAGESIPNIIEESDRDRQISLATKLNVALHDPKQIDNQKISIYPDDTYTLDERFFSVGVVTEGLYKGGEVILERTLPDGPVPSDYFNYFIRMNTGGVQKFYFLSLNSDSSYEYGYFDKSKVAEVKDLLLPILPAKEVTDKDGSHYALDPYVREFFDPAGLTPAFISPEVGDIYYKKTSNQKVSGSDVYDRGGFYNKDAMGLLQAYDFVDPQNAGKAGVTLVTGDMPKDTYKSFDIGGCGARNYVSLPDVVLGDLVAIGRSKFDGKPVYALKDQNSEILKNLYNLTAMTYDQEELRPTMSYEEFIKKLPVYFWQDKYGRLIKFQNETLMPFAECGKPVIYLYPKATTSVSVKVSPRGGFSKTIPEYNNGWNVVATPESLITNIETGLAYPYLFWEGRGGIYETPKKGWVVEESNIKSFLDQKLSELGLNIKEKTDFMEFWLPKMSGAPYYFVTFLSNHEMDAIAPLSISPKPDTVIRILMDFTPLKEKMAALPFTIKTPERKGFTVVEWGGVLWK